MLEKLNMHVGEFMRLKNERSMKDRHMLKEQRARESVLHRDHQNETKQVTKCDLRVGDTASYQHNAVTIEGTDGHAAGSPITATIRLANGSSKRVKFEELRPVGTHRKQHTIPRVSTVEVGNFIFYEEKGDMYLHRKDDSVILECVFIKPRCFYLHAVYCNESRDA